MISQFSLHYTRAEAEALLPQVQVWLDELTGLRRVMADQEARLAELLASGQDAGGPVVGDWIKSVAAMRRVFHEFQAREIQIKDLDRGLIDFPAYHDGREVYLCWERGEEGIEFWHELDDGYAGRERL